MKLGQVHMLVALCLCTGVLRTGAENIWSRLLNSRKQNNQPCDKKKDCCDGLHCVGPFTEGGTKTCQISHCIPDGKQCNNGERPHKCCDGFVCLLQENEKQNCGPCRGSGAPCTNNYECCSDSYCKNVDQTTGFGVCKWNSTIHIIRVLPVVVVRWGARPNE